MLEIKVDWETGTTSHDGRFRLFAKRDDSAPGLLKVSRVLSSPWGEATTRIRYYTGISWWIPRWMDPPGVYENPTVIPDPSSDSSDLSISRKVAGITGLYGRLEMDFQGNPYRLRMCGRPGFFLRRWCLEKLNADQDWVRIVDANYYSRTATLAPDIDDYERWLVFLVLALEMKHALFLLGGMYP